MRILIVDDSATQRLLIKNKISEFHLGHEFADAINGKVALDQIEKFKPDLVISDWNMPEMDGLELFEKIKNQSKRPKFVFATGNASKILDEELSASGADLHFRKPLNQEIVEQIFSLFKD